MSDSDNSSYILRYDLLSQTPQYFVGADWYDFVTSGGGCSPAGPNTSVQFNNAGSFAGDSSLEFKRELGDSTLLLTGQNSSDDPTLSINADPAAQGSIIFGNLDQTDNWVELDGAPSGLYVAVNQPGGDIEMQPGALSGPSFTLTPDGAMALTPLTGAQITALTPSLGWIVVNSDTNHLEYYNGTTWVSL